MHGSIARFEFRTNAMWIPFTRVRERKKGEREGKVKKEQRKHHTKQTI